MPSPNTAIRPANAKNPIRRVRLCIQIRPMTESAFCRRRRSWTNLSIMAQLLMPPEQAAYQNPHHERADHACGGMRRYVLLGIFHEFRDFFDKFAKLITEFLFV